MKQWVSKQDGLEKLQLLEAPMPDAAGLKEGEVLVKINRVSLNYRDTEGMQRTYQQVPTSGLELTAA